MTGRKAGRPKGPELTKERARSIRARSRAVKRAQAQLDAARAALADELRAGRDEGVALRDLGAAADLVVSRVFALTNDPAAVSELPVASGGTS